jgi:hypothetical protein
VLTMLTKDAPSMHVNSPKAQSMQKVTCCAFLFMAQMAALSHSSGRTFPSMTHAQPKDEPQTFQDT